MDTKTQPDRLYRRIADHIIAAIEAGQYAHGGKLPTERDLAESFGTSRPTVREAMIALEIMGYVEIRDRSGIYVTFNKDSKSEEVVDHRRALDLNVGAFELIEARIFVECAAAGLAAEAATDEDIAFLRECLKDMTSDITLVRENSDRAFHVHIAYMSNNGALAATIDYLWDLRRYSPLASNIFMRALGDDKHDRIDEHIAVLEALEKRSPDAARLAMRAHLESVRDYVFKATEIDEIDAIRTRLTEQKETYMRRSRKNG